MAYSLMADVQRLFPSHQMSTTSTVKIADVEACEAEDPGVPVQGSGKGWERRALALLKELAPERAALSADSAPRAGIGGGTFVTGYHEDGDTAIAPPVSMADEF